MVYCIVEVIKWVFVLCDVYIIDLCYLDVDVQQLFILEVLQLLVDSIDDVSVYFWGGGKGLGDIVWMGVVDNSGLVVLFIQSIYYEFGSGVVILDIGIVW